jgi:hypothetical protein
MTLVNYFPDFLLLLRDVRGQSQTVAQREADAKSSQIRIGQALDTLRCDDKFCCSCCYYFLPPSLPIHSSHTNQVGCLLQWVGFTDSALMTRIKRFILAFGGRLEMHSEPRTGFTTCCGACGPRVRAVNLQIRILAPACNCSRLLSTLDAFVYAIETEK